jgi:hypothetical protein
MWAAGCDWRDASCYAPLLHADRSLFAWEWLRRDGQYRAAARIGGLSKADCARARRFGLAAFVSPDQGAPDARPMWLSTIHPFVLPVEKEPAEADDRFDLGQVSGLASLIETNGTEHLLLTDGWKSIRLDAPAGTFSEKPCGLRYSIHGLASAETRVLTLRRFLAFVRSGRFSRVLHPSEPRARRWILMLRAWDGLEAGANQREIAEQLLSRSAGEPRWRSEESSIRSQVQRLVRSARVAASAGYPDLLA